MSDPIADGAPTRISLREQLGGAADPDFALVLPPGWERREVTSDEEERMLSGVRSRLRDAHRPDLYARMSELVQEAFVQMRRVSTVAMFLPSPDAEDALYLPASLTAGVQHADAGTNLDSFVASAVRTQGATPLLEDKRFLRVERDATKTLDGDTTGVTTVVYLTPVPGSQRRRALQLTLVVMHPVDAPPDDPPLVAIKALFDLCVSTLNWIPAR